MNQLSVMFIAGEPSGDALAAELVRALRASPRVKAMSYAPVFFGAGGPQMAQSGVQIDTDMMPHAVVGLLEVASKLVRFKRIFDRLLDLAFARQPDVIVLVDFSDFNHRFAHAVRRRLNHGAHLFSNWRPRIVKYVSPQVWASRPGRAYTMAQDLDLLLCLYAFEPGWYAQRVPSLRVEFVGHPLVERFALPSNGAPAGPQGISVSSTPTNTPLVLLLPGSRVREVRAHLPVMIAAARRLGAQASGSDGAEPALRPRWRVVLPNESLSRLAHGLVGTSPGIDMSIQIGGLESSLAEARLAIAASGTVTIECAWLRVPAVVIYKTSWFTYLIARQIANVDYVAMPNLLAGGPVYPELLQGAATPENIADSALSLLTDERRREDVRVQLDRVLKALGEPGASNRAAQAILSLV